MAITKTEHPFPNLTGSSIVKSSIPVFLIGTVDTTTVYPRMCVEAKGGSTSNADAKQFIIGGANSKRIIGWVTFSLINKITLAENNANPSIGTATTLGTAFAADDKVEIAMRIPVVEAILTTGQGTCFAGQRYVCAGNGYLGTHPDSIVTAVTTAAATYYLAAASLGIPLDPTIAIGLSLVSTADSLQVIQVMPLW
jgi:hypothetical protein